MPSIANNVPSRAEQKPKPTYKQLIATKLAHFDTISSMLSSLYYFNIAVGLLLIFNRFPRINLFIIGAHLCMAALARLLRTFIRPDEVDFHSARIKEHKLSEEMAVISRKFEIEFARLSDLEERNRRLLRDLDEQKKAIASEERGSFNTRCKEYQLTPTEQEALLQVFEKAQESLKKAPSEAAEAVVFKMVEWSSRCFGHHTMQVELREGAFCFAWAP